MFDSFLSKDKQKRNRANLTESELDTGSITERSMSDNLFCNYMVFAAAAWEPD